jgi:hypothetical protein
VVLLVGVATVSLAAAAQAFAGGSTLRVSSVRVLYGHPVTLTGRVASHRAGQRIGIVIHRYGRSGTRVATTVLSGTGGYWTYRGRPSVQTTYQARVGSRTSRAVTVGVQPLVSVHELGKGRLSVRVAAGRSFSGRMIKLQRRVSGGGWATVTQKQLASRSALVFATSIPSSTIRIAMSVNQAGAGYLGTVSHPFRYRAYSLSLVPSGYKVGFGKRLELSGRLANVGAGQTITIYQRQFRRSAPSRLATVRTSPNGTWAVRVKPVVQTSYFARWGRIESPSVRVGVMPLITAHQTANGVITARVLAAVAFSGRLVKLQRLVTGGAWQTVAQKPLNHKSVVVFRNRVHAGTVRIAMSVNEAGAGFLGATSRVLAYHPI